MKIIQLKRMYLPALSILGVVVLLLFLISISTYRNLDREEKTVLKFVHQQGLALIHAIEAGARAGMIMPMWKEDSVESLILETGKNEDIAYLYLIDSQGKVIHHSNPSFVGMSSAWMPLLSAGDPVQSRVRNLPSGDKVYDLAKRFTPLKSKFSSRMHGSMAEHHHNMLPHQHADSIIVLGLKMATYEAARRSDIHHAVVMAAILIALGSGALFFIFVIQNYYLVDKTLKQTQDYTRQVVANMANGLLSINLKGRIVSYNLLALELLGLNERNVHRVDLKSIIDFESTGIERTLTKHKAVLEKEYHHPSKTGLVPMNLSVTPIIEEENICTGAVIVLRDLREIKQLEAKVQHSEKLAAIGRLAAGVAHEIRNPLSSIKGFARFLAHALEGQPQEQEYAQIMVKEVDRIDGVVNDLLSFARPLESELAPTDIKELIAHTVKLVQADADTRDVVIRQNIALDLKKVSVDANQITQALLNLMLNALHEVDAGGSIIIGADSDRSGERLRIWIEDEGPGILEDKKEKIFDPFFTTREKGTGLGLAIVQKIVENHNAEIQLDSPLPGSNRGCRFTITIPANPYED